MSGSRANAGICLSCGWKGTRAAANVGPCPKCNANHVVVAGSPDIIPLDPVLIAKTLDAHPFLFWRVQRALGNRRLVGPWMPVGPNYWERADLDGVRVAWIWFELGGFNWETGDAKGSVSELRTAQARADGALMDRDVDEHWRIVDPVR